MPQPVALHVGRELGLLAHSVPHSPQFFRSLSSRTQLPAHSSYPSLQSMPQPLGPQTAAPFSTVGHALPQPWQWVGSVAVFTQAPQSVVSGGQSFWHLPAAHTSPMGHGLSQPPQ